MKVGIFHTAFIGDIALLGMLIEGLVQAGHDVCLISNANALKLFQDDPRLASRVLVEKPKGLKKIFGIFKIAQSIKKQNVDVLLVPHRSATTSLCVFFSRVAVTIGYNVASLNFVYSLIRPYKKEIHETQRNMFLAPAWLIPTEIKEKLRTQKRTILFSQGSLENFTKKFPLFFASSAPYFILCPGSVWETKKYPVLSFAKVVQLLLQQHKTLRCVLAGSNAEKQDVEKILAFLRATESTLVERCFDVSGLLPLNELVSLSAKAHFMVSNDSAPQHISTGTNTPTISLFGPTDLAMGFGPQAEEHLVLTYADEFGQKLSCQPCSPHGQHRCPLGHHDCMQKLRPETVAQKIISFQKKLFSHS